MLSMSRSWLLYLLVVVLGSFHHVVSLLCIYWRKIIIFLFINFHFHQWNSLQTFFGIMWQLCYGMPIQTSFYFLTNPTYHVRFPDVSLHVCISLSVSVELGLRFQQSFHTIHLLRSSETHLISSHIHCSRSHLPHSGNGCVPPDLNGPELLHNLLASLLFLEYLDLHGARLGSEWFILE